VDKLSEYRRIIKQALIEHIALAERSPLPEVETVPAFDEAHDEYIVRDVGWLKRRRVRNTFLHLRLRNGKIWIEEDWTEEGIATALLNAGVPKEDIVLGFQPPEMRPYTEFAVA
jgi:hypothetical protein